MADPAGPSVAKDPDELEGATSNEQSADAGAPGPKADLTDAAPADEVPGTGPPPLGAELPDGSEQATESAEAGEASIEPASEHLAVEDEGTVALADPPLEQGPGDPTPTTTDESPDDRTDAVVADGSGTDDGDPDDDGVDDDDDDRKRSSGGLLTKEIKLNARTVLIIVALLAAAAGAYALGQKQAQDATKSPTGTSTPTSRAGIPQGFIPFEDKETGIKLAIPKDWPQFSTKDLDPSYRLLLGVPNAKDTLRVRMNAYSSDVTAANIGDQRAVIDAILTGEKVSILAAETLAINGMPTLFYVYKFNDPTNGPGLHAHFFVFQGKKMVTMVFEAVPEERYALLAPVFDAIKDTLVVAPGPPPSFLNELPGGEPSATTVPATTTVPGAPPASTPGTSTP